NKDSFHSTEKDRTGFFLTDCVDTCNDLGLSRTHFLVKSDTSELAGFITLSAFGLKIRRKYGPRGKEEADESEIDYFPMMKIDQIAVSQQFIRKGLGSQMIDWLIALIYNELTPIFGCKFIICEIFDNKSNIGFFKNKYRFFEIPEEWIRSRDKREFKIRTERKFGRDKTTVNTVKVVMILPDFKDE
ncbi:MAG: GNAT family N-acetyltransferase, partial [Candidatus Hodarchaeales archaeon]